jgi:hypothetical protein
VETQEDEVADSSQSDGLSFGFAKVWEQGKGSLAEVTETALDNNDADDFWAKVLEKNRANEAKLEEEKKMGRGARRVAAKKKPVSYTHPSRDNYLNERRCRSTSILISPLSSPPVKGKPLL